MSFFNHKPSPSIFVAIFPMFSSGGSAAEALTLRRKHGRFSSLGAASSAPRRAARGPPPKRCVYQFTQKPFFMSHGPPPTLTN